MKCTACGGATEIIDTQKFDAFVWRRRRCITCNHRINTHETVVETTQNSRTVRLLGIDEPAHSTKAKSKVPQKMPPTPQPQVNTAPKVKTARELIEELREQRKYENDW